MEQVDTLHVARYWSEVLRSTIMTHLGDLEVKVTDLEILCLSFWLKFFKSLYLLTMLMDQVDTLHVARYWSEVLRSTIMTHLGDLEVKVTDLEILCLSFWLKFFKSLYLLNMLMDRVDTLHIDIYWSEVLCCTIMDHLGDHEVKVTDLEILC